MKKEKSFRVFVIYALLLQFAILLSQQTMIEKASLTTVSNYNARSATVQVLVSYVDIGAEMSEEVAYTGTGTVIAVNSDDVYVLTARHVCAPNPFTAASYGLQESVEIRDSEGSVHPAKVTLVSYDEDLCIVKYQSFGHDLLHIAKFAAEEAPMDAGVYMYAAPAGFYVPSAITMFQGNYAGKSILWAGPVAVYTIPATGGASGAGILNRNGEIVGVLHSVLSDFQHISLGTTHRATIDFIKDLEVQESISILD